MHPKLKEFHQCRLEETAKALRKNNFAAHVVETAQDAKELILGTLLPECKPGSVSFGGSMTLAENGIYEAVKAVPGLKIFDTYNYSLPPAEMVELRRQALLADLFITSTNAVTEQGALVNLDGTGNRVASLTFGPKKVIVVAGRNKLCPDEFSAMEHIRSLAAPVNAARLSKKTPCVSTHRCEDCLSPERICNTWTITVKSAPKERTVVVLVNEDMGF
ncbi:lactate utilization protein [Fundidesulfovibrio soli]|uniref:lactate utilization protein n=1 Tax=Fundidesulfovibrio soli TaxID=2922716 RepID=UPI001FAF5286|nr:lactate utilization protein [Fundidesulfovibrio soli]